MLLPPRLVGVFSKPAAALAGLGVSLYPRGNDPVPSGSSQPSWMRTCSRRTFSCLFCPLPSHSPLPRGQAGPSLVVGGVRTAGPQRVSHVWFDGFWALWGP